MVEIKTEGAAALIQIPGLDARTNFDNQSRRLIGSVRQEGKGRRVFFCVGSQRNVEDLQRDYGRSNPDARFLVCQ